MSLTYNEISMPEPNKGTIRSNFFSEFPYHNKMNKSIYNGKNNRSWFLHPYESNERPLKQFINTQHNKDTFTAYTFP